MDSVYLRPVFPISFAVVWRLRSPRIDLVPLSGNQLPKKFMPALKPWNALLRFSEP